MRTAAGTFIFADARTTKIMLNDICPNIFMKESYAMTLTKKDLYKWEETTFTPLTAEQRRMILERFGTEPDPYEWSEQDIAVQIGNFLACGEFVKSVQDNGRQSTSLRGAEF